MVGAEWEERGRGGFLSSQCSPRPHSLCPPYIKGNDQAQWVSQCNMCFMTGSAQRQATGEHCFIALTAHFSSLQTKPRANASTNAAEGIFYGGIFHVNFQNYVKQGVFI